MARLNSRYRGKPRPTDVLSFPAPEPIRSLQGALGELVICLPVLTRQAREQGHRAELELWVLLAHGLLHLLGMDHEKGGKQAAEMARWEKKLLSAVIPLASRRGPPGLIRRSYSDSH
jgi:probable rRNA maturation factor